MPAEINIPEIQARSSLIQTGLNPDGSLEVPALEEPMQASYYTKFPFPGEFVPDDQNASLSRPAVILGHVNGNGQPGIFSRLTDLKIGDTIEITYKDQSQKVYEVYDYDEMNGVVDNHLESDKDSFPTDTVYRKSADNEIRLITCGGALDREAGSYEDNIIVYAKLRGPPTEGN